MKTMKATKAMKAMKAAMKAMKAKAAAPKAMKAEDWMRVWSEGMIDRYDRSYYSTWERWDERLERVLRSIDDSAMERKLRAARLRVEIAQLRSMRHFMSCPYGAWAGVLT